mmetsp:Transcript_60924/g.178716  ORF Transcript_60924/g.178716 Transcript_60924/m.178716 type:complete len:243 (+) Transcript_60924:69-797(+)
MAGPGSPAWSPSARGHRRGVHRQGCRRGGNLASLQTLLLLLRLAPHHVGPLAADLEVAVELLGRLLGGLALREGHEGAEALRDHLQAADLAVDVELVADLLLLRGGVQPSQVQRRDGLVLRRIQRELLIGTTHDLLRERVVLAVEAVLQLLVGQLAALRQLVPEGAVLSAVARALHVEGADACLVPLVVRRHAGQPLQHRVRGLAVLRVYVLCVGVVLHVLELVVAANARECHLRLLLAQLL